MEQARSAFARGDFQRCTTSARSALLIYENNSGSPQQLATAHWRLGSSYYRSGNLNGAKVHFAQAAAHDPSNPEYRRSLSEVRAKLTEKERLQQLAHDTPLFEEIHKLTSRWNEAAGPLVRDYLDPTIPASTWVYQARSYLNTMRVTQNSMQFVASQFQHPEFRSIYRQISLNYKRKLAATTRIHFAVANGDSEAEERGQREMQAATAEAQVLVQRLVSLSSKYYGRDNVDRELSRQIREKSAKMERQMQPR